MATVTAPARAHRSGWTITEGVLLVIAGLLAVFAPLTTAAIVGWALPFVLLAEGVVLIVTAFRGRSVGGTIWSIVLGVVALIAGFAVLARPAIAIASLPTILGIYLVAKGILEFAAATQMTEGRGWIYTAAVLNIVLAILIWVQPFGASLALTGLYIGLSILMTGIALLAMPGEETGRAGNVVNA